MEPLHHLAPTGCRLPSGIGDVDTCHDDHCLPLPERTVSVVGTQLQGRRLRRRTRVVHREAVSQRRGVRIPFHSDDDIDKDEAMPDAST